MCKFYFVPFLNFNYNAINNSVSRWWMCMTRIGHAYNFSALGGSKSNFAFCVCVGHCAEPFVRRLASIIYEKGVSFVKSHYPAKAILKKCHWKVRIITLILCIRDVIYCYNNYKHLLVDKRNGEIQYTFNEHIFITINIVHCVRRQ